jgi:hypothetical protein
MRQRQRRQYLVVRGGQCSHCKPHDWRAFRDPEERDCMQPCILTPLYAVEAVNKREAVAEAKRRFMSDAPTAHQPAPTGEI